MSKHTQGAPAALVISEISIRQDTEGRYCLNDLHRAAATAGANERTKEPAKFFASPQTAELLAELTDAQNLGIAPVNAIKGGTNQGTFVVRELVYAYAMWISPSFHLKVIRAYDALVTRPTRRNGLVELPDPLSPETRAAIDQRAWELSRHVYEHFRAEMLNDAALREGRAKPEAWVPRCVQHAPLKVIESTAKLLETMAFGLRAEGARLAGLFGFDYHAITGAKRPD